ncbi:hypothetical protein [Variovorax paradoxus]|uniref:hypothetical protein n=1 Tax=Variovorax paradoxus TaxID=34073 RepID=UPI003D64C62A
MTTQQSTGEDEPCLPQDCDADEQVYVMAFGEGLDASHLKKSKLAQLHRNYD